MMPCNLRSLVLAAVVLSNCITWTASRHHYTHNVSGHRSRHRRQGAGLFLSASYVLPGGEGTGWGEWGEVSPCSRTCGGGVASQKRICLQIGPDGQPQCTGGDTKYFSCQTQDCPAGSKDFREQQCSEFDDQAFRDIKYKWVPYTKAPNPCELNCMPHGERFYYRHRTKVIDGTRCNDESFDVCVNGTCQPVGCDMMLGSTAREDKCRECRGNGANCHTTKGLLDTQDLRKGYNDMLLIPEGATTILIAEISPSNNYLALRAKNGTYYLNGHYHIDFPRTLVIAGALWTYDRSQQGFAAPDKLKCLGPTNEPLYLALLLQDVNVGIEYEYSVPNELAPPRNKQYNWVHDEFAPCSAACGGGYQTRNVSCRSREELELVNEGLCDVEIKPPTNQTCNTDPCAAQWTPGPWGKCSKRCGEGGTRSREVQCTQIITNGYPSIVAEKNCFDLLGPKPALFQECNDNASCPIWFTGPWKPCDKLCDEGKQTRQVVCYQKNGRRIEVLGDDECEDEKPAAEQKCILQTCEGVDWVLSEWSGCDSCLSTVRSREVSCATKERKVVNDTFCANHVKPETQEPCDKTKLPPCEVQWYATQWSKCSVDCGKGIKTRKVFCGLFDGASVLKVGDERCAGQPKYNDTVECEIPKDKCPSKWFSGPWTECTEECGGGEQYRKVMCLRSEEPATDCDPKTVLDSTQSCNIEPCGKESIDSSEEPDDYEDCVEEEELYTEVGLDALTSTIDDDFMSTMFSDSPSTEGSGEGSSIWTSTSTGEQESTFPDTDSTLSSEELLTTGTTSSDTDITGTDGSGYGSTTELDTGATSNETDSTATDETESGSGETELTSSSIDDGSTTTVSDITYSTDTSTTDVSGATSNETDSTATDETESGSGETELTSSSIDDGSTTTVSDITYSTDTSTTDVSGQTETTETGPSSVSTEETSVSVSSFSTESDGTTESGGTSDTVTTESDATSDTDTTESGSTDATATSDSEATDETITTESQTTDETATTESELTSETESTLESSTDSSTTDQSTESETSESTIESESTSGDTEGSTSESSTTEAGTTESGSTEVTETTDLSSTDATATTESSSTEATETTETGSTETAVTTESGTTDATETTEIVSSTTETTDTGSTETTDTESTDTTLTSETSSTEPTDTTVSGSTESTETTVSGSTEPTETTESGSTISTDTTETGSTESTETTETENTATTESETGSTESTVTEEITTEVSGSTETTESDSTVTSEGTESITESSTTEGLSSMGSRTPWDLSSTVDLFTKKPRVCKPRSCLKTKFGCCPDKKTKALGPFDDGCPKPHTCKESPYKCCPDGLSPAQGPDHKGCPTEPCAETLFGCCQSDNKTAAQGNDQEGCPPPPPACRASKYGCCKDNETEATGPAKEGCPETTVAETEEPVWSTTTFTTEGDLGCASSEYGCCFDNETAAAGPDRQGCPCNTSEYGCCPDGVAPAQGPALEGCVKSCKTSTYGCCPDDKTPAHGPDGEGCCLLYAYGCCPDNFKPADGPHLEGCGCQNSRYGCCPDNITVASGPDNKGCGCQYTEFGCCPDRHSDASGPDFEGCLCHTYQFGCCPDGVTIARGPNGQGCYCQQSKFGCCGDEQTHAKGPNKEGCDCATSKHGCCLDGTTEATGPKFEGCTDKPENKQAACSLKFERGSCRNYSVNWYYDTQYGGCSRFWYGGCEGNGNRFASKEECEDTCVSPPPKYACKLPQIKGACLGYNVRWYFDNERDSCTNFIYGGCLGNNNNFESRELCQAQCEPERTLDQCTLSIESGSCAGNYPRWGFNKETRRCERFTWSGCEGNSNRFSTEAACLLRCNPPGEPQPECSEPTNVGNCTDIEALWSFSQSENRCVPFHYTGCGGNANHFRTKEQCQEACPSAFVPELCTLPASTGDCSDYREKWYFDTKDQRCRQFYYGGCGGNGNKFDTEGECSARCSSQPTTTAAPAVTAPAPTPRATTDLSEYCFLAIDAGPCNQLEEKWAYDYTKGKCVTFQYGGCGGNQNNFPSKKYCNYYCKPAQDICQLPMLAGPCDESLMRWFYDASTDSCSQFTYGGCEGNENRFESRQECENRCKTGPVASSTAPPTTTTTVKVENRINVDSPPECSISSELEECRPENTGEVWYFDPDSNVCSAHQNIESGTECRTTGTFYSQEACERSCGVFRNLDVCRYVVDPGPCNEYAAKYQYNVTSNRCEEFAYGGCLGGPNRFSTEQECEHVCMSAVDPCTLPPEPGNCLGRIELWYYDQSQDLCNQFAYGGCGGNENKFDTRELCEGRCKKQPSPIVTTTTPLPIETTRQPQPEDECRTPSSLEPCGRNFTVFYYDHITSSCKVADIGDCGHPNRYRSEEECERRCGVFRDLDVCRARLDPGPCRASIPKFYFDAASGSCKEYAYGGCQGGPNRFSTSDECEAVCSASGPAPACLQEVAVGSRCGAIPERRWHYDVTRADCLVFAYQGCGGNENNFPSYEECTELCRVRLPGSDGSRVCDQYAEECSTLERTCVYGIRTAVAPEGCERCSCEEPPKCEELQRECDALRCSYGVQRSRTDENCEKCKCYEDPCLSNNCTSNEKCIVASDHRDSTTQERLYSAHCVPKIDSNEVIPECEAHIGIEACARISCPYGVQRTRTAEGCERCACVHVEVDCAPLQRECAALKCRFGLQREAGDDGCERCKCLEHPCSAKVCPEGERCVAKPFYDAVTLETRYSADCRIINKEGECPSSEEISRSTEAGCRRECNDDADCRGVLKCCGSGCSQLCLAPLAPTTVPPTTTRGPEVPHAPQVSNETEPEVQVSEGGKAALRCIFHGNPPPKITWRFGEIIIDGDRDRYLLRSDGALEIVSLVRTDSGVYICIAENDLGKAQQEVILRVNDPVSSPAGIAGEPGATVVGELGEPFAVRCLAYGFPEPTIYWFRGHGGPMVPISSNIYEYGRQELLIRRLTVDTLGEYECQAYNGVGPAVTWPVTVQGYRRDQAGPGSPYVVPRRDPPPVVVTPRVQIVDTTHTTPTTPQQALMPFAVPVMTRLLPASTTLTVGAQLNLPCEVDGYPEPNVHWTKDNALLEASDRIWITASRLTIPQVGVADSGEYGCHAANDYTSHSSAVAISVQDLYIPAKCVDNPTFANCALIVQSRFCVHKYYSKFCCKSCVEAGQLNPRDAEMQADEPFRKK